MAASSHIFSSISAEPLAGSPRSGASWPGADAPIALFGVIGWPLAQSLSPLVHNTGFRALGIPAVYLRWEVAPERLGVFMEAVRLLDIRGCSVTIPHKQAIMPFLDVLSEAATLAGAANTLYWNEGALCGDNTDVAGFLAPLAGEALERMDALLLGAGGAAHAVAAALRLRGCERVRVATPGNSRHLALAERFGFTPVAWAERYDAPAAIVINATPLGMRGKAEDGTAYDFALAPEVPGGIAYDIVYNPAETRFLREARAAGRRCIDGVEMFFGQADAQFRIWTGRGLPEAARQALVTALKAR
ncbi:MAG: shikimate dehydrogenase [Desulfovibrio sp.]|nr:shikimate dehydrogenase [Desulfovibrio sp.]